MTHPRTSGVVVRADAYTGTAQVTGAFTAEPDDWALERPRYEDPVMRPAPVDPADWQDPAVGWGLILPERPDLDAAALATANDAPEPIRELVAQRSGKVLRYRSGAALSDWTLRDYRDNGQMLTAAVATGTGYRQIPKYLLIYATPSEIPWRFQYSLNPVRCVGRLDLDGEALASYIQALMNGWADAACDYTCPLVWAVDHGGGDITTTMRDVLAEPVFRSFDRDPEMTGATFVDGSAAPATAESLIAALENQHPAIVVSSSHGMTGPLDQAAAMRASLGLPVDADQCSVSPQDLLARWQPDGAIWYGQACCSAGSDAQSAYNGLFADGSLLSDTLSAIAANAGAVVSPLPRALLGARKPLRAFIGHVEPTFDWTLEFPDNHQELTVDLTSAIYDGLAGGEPVGLAMARYYPAIGGLLQGYANQRSAYNTSTGRAAATALDMLVYSRVTANDRASTVILGDPTAALTLPGRVRASA